MSSDVFLGPGMLATMAEGILLDLCSTVTSCFIAKSMAKDERLCEWYHLQHMQ